MFCEKCGNSVNLEDLVCSHCGQELAPPKTPEKKQKTVVTVDESPVPAQGEPGLAAHPPAPGIFSQTVVSGAPLSPAAVATGLPAAFPQPTPPKPQGDPLGYVVIGRKTIALLISVAIGLIGLYIAWDRGQPWIAVVAAALAVVVYLAQVITQQFLTNSNRMLYQAERQTALLQELLALAKDNS